MIELGGAKAWKVRLKGDVVVAFHYVNGEPALVLYKKPGVGTTNRPGAYIIPLESAYKYADAKSGLPTTYAIRQAVIAAEQIGFFPDSFTVTRIIDAIVDGLIDLIEMPPEPQGMSQKQAEVVGEMIVKCGGRTIKEGEVTTNAAGELELIQ
jgi:hypothetical protein